MNSTDKNPMPPHTLLYADAEIPDIRAFLAAVHTAADHLGPQTHIICINADKVAGSLHVKTALSHACRAWFADKNPVARSFEMEVLLWVAASRQTSEAAGFGAQNGAMALWVLVVGAEKRPEDEIARLPGMTLHASPPLSAEEMNAGKRARLMQDFSVTEEELSTVGNERLPELIAERVALSAVYR
ncbi:KEOPS complex subunit Cgi121 [Methanogenium sp. S4BF]|uniref:KEOPS complex subunit Cgi121 n=1 Tax=Methanogenium sp. S4BF TaxID=1789226 RepID=UPI0024170479|nr:KEOPS complex subunit Cgi121 [Methanogenium sp. S4BF]WFN34096.1 KEOPS complex subunit Cgi121 [Methanogenium sp. S4BF]